VEIFLHRWKLPNRTFLQGWPDTALRSGSRNNAARPRQPNGSKIVAQCEPRGCSLPQVIGFRKYVHATQVNR
jgi:hypothetical protein